MSLHATLSPEAIKRLEKQKKTSTITSFFIALLTITLLSLIMGLFLLKPTSVEVPVFITYKPPIEEDIKPEITPKPTQTETSPPRLQARWPK